MHELIKQIQKQNIRALARAITIIENNNEEKQSLLMDAYELPKSAYVIGITGSPGAGKSTLVNRLLTEIREEGLTAAVLAVDPTSPFSGGALLGDRVRMNEHDHDEGVFIRSMATRGYLGGLSRATKEALLLCHGFGFDVVIVETVGVGQSELDIMKIVDTTTLVLTPNSGDILQIYKAGVMEIADLFVINKADLPGVNKIRGLLRELNRTKNKDDLYIEVVKTVAIENVGIDKLWEKLKARRDLIKHTKEGQEKRLKQYELELNERIQEFFWNDFQKFIKENQDLAGNKPERNIYKHAQDLYEKWKTERSFTND